MSAPIVFFDVAGPAGSNLASFYRKVLDGKPITPANSRRLSPRRCVGHFGPIQLRSAFISASPMSRRPWQPSLKQAELLTRRVLKFQAWSCWAYSGIRRATKWH
jgi:hypothetical protein